MDLIAKVKLEMIIPDGRLEEVTRAIVDSARTGKIGDGKIFIYDVGSAIRIRNEDRDDIAL